MRKLTRLFALMLALTMLLGALPALAEEPANPSGIPYYKVTSDLYDFIDMDGAPIQIEIYSQLANYSGRQTGWGAALMKDLFNVELVIIPDQDGTYQTRTQSGNLGDIVVWGANQERSAAGVGRRRPCGDICALRLGELSGCAGVQPSGVRKRRQSVRLRHGRGDLPSGS